MTCIFCKIIRGEIPSWKLFENDHIIAFLDITPISKGHTLVVPKRHAPSFDDLKEEEIAQIGQAIQRIAPALLKSVNATAYNIGMNNGKDAGQVVDHAHVHIIPRFPNDGLESWPGKDPENLENLAGAVRKLLANV